MTADHHLVLLRVQLFAAMQMLKGDDAIAFKQLLYDIVQCVDGHDEFVERIKSHRPYIAESES